jgi:fumarate hydratase class II
MDATPLTLGDEFSAYTAQLNFGLTNINNALRAVSFLPIGGTAVGNGINAPEGYDEKVVRYINILLGERRKGETEKGEGNCVTIVTCNERRGSISPSNFEGVPEGRGSLYQAAPNKFESISSHDAFVELSSASKRLAVSLMKIANDIRLLGSGPRCGFGELLLPENEPGSSIMPGKVNPTQCEALTMVCCQVIGNDVAITTGAMQGHLQLNVFMPLIAQNILQSINLLSDAMNSFNEHCVQGIQPNVTNIKKHLENSLMLVTKLNPIIGYSNAAKIAQYAHKNDLTLKDAALELQLISEEEFDKAMNLNF